MLIPRKIINSTDLNDLGVFFVCLKGYWNNLLRFSSHLKIQNGAFFKMAFILHKHRFWSLKRSQLADLNDLGVILYVLKAAGIIYYGYLAL